MHFAFGRSRDPFFRLEKGRILLISSWQLSLSHNFRVVLDLLIEIPGSPSQRSASPIQTPSSDQEGALKYAKNCEYVGPGTYGCFKSSSTKELYSNFVNGKELIMHRRLSLPVGGECALSNLLGWGHSPEMIRAGSDLMEYDPPRLF